MYLKVNNYYPLVTIVIPVYNGANYLREAIDSALDQTYKNVEIIVVNDGSTDDGTTEAIAKSYGNKITYHYKDNGGVATALNFGINKMTGDYFSWLSHDDFYHKDRLRLMMEVILENGGSVAAYSSVSIIDSDGCEISVSHPNYNVINKSLKTFLAFDVDTGLNGCSLIVPKEFFQRYGLFNTELRYTQDYDMWFRMSGERFINVSIPLTISRRHAAQDSQVLTEACTLAADTLHSQMVAQLKPDDILSILADNQAYFLKSIETYRNAGYAKTALNMSVLFLKLAVNTGNSLFWEIANSDLFGNDKHASLVNNKRLTSLTNKIKNQSRILFYTNVWCKGGVEKFLSILMPQLVGRFDVFLAYSGDFMTNGFAVPDTITAIHIKQNVRPSRKHDLAERLTCLCVGLEIDLFIGNPNIMEEFLPIYRMMREVGIKTIACNHGNYFLPYQYKWLHSTLRTRKIELPHADVSTWPLEDAALIYSQYAFNGAYMPNSVNMIKNMHDYGPERNKVIICVARFDDLVKRVDRMIDILDRVLLHDQAASVLMVGPYPQEDTAEYDAIKDIAVRISKFKDDFQGRVVFTGEVNDVSSYYERAGILLLTSESEGFALVLLEASCHFIPVVAFDYLGLNSIINDGENGFVVSQGDISLAVEKILLLLNNSSLRDKMGCRAAELVKRFSVENQKKRWEHLIDRLLLGEARETFEGFLLKEFIPNHPLTTSNVTRILRFYEQETVRGAELRGNGPTILCRSDYRHITLANRKINKEITETIDVLSKEEMERLYSYLQQRSLSKPLIMFHMYGWLCGGMERVLSSIVNGLCEDYDVIFAVFEPALPSHFFIDSRVHFVVISGHENRIGRLLALVEIVRPSVFIGNNNSIPEFLRVYQLLRELQIKSVAYSHESYFFVHADKYLFPILKNKREALSLADVSVFLTNFATSIYNLQNSNGILMPNPSPFRRRKPDFSRRNGRTVLAVGRFDDPIKGLDRLLECLWLVLQTHPDTVLKIVGSYNLGMLPRNGKNESIGDQLLRLGLTQHNLEFLGVVQNVEPFYECADILVVTSYNEGFPMGVCEGISSGLPVVLQDIPGLEDLVVDGFNGFSVPQGDAQAMADKISLLLHDDELRRTFSRKSYDHAANFEMYKILSRWKKLLLMLCEKSTNIHSVAERFRQEFPIRHIQPEQLLAKIVLEFENTANLIAEEPSSSPSEITQDSVNLCTITPKNNVYKFYSIRKICKQILRYSDVRKLGRKIKYLLNMECEV